MSRIPILSIGAGVQSSCLGMMMVHGYIPKADVAIFADTGSEPRNVYLWLEWLKDAMRSGGIPIVTTMQGKGLTKAVEDACSGKETRVSTPPVFTENGGRVYRQCTWDYKVMPIRRKLKELYGKKAKFDMTCGISFDERQRCKPSDVKFITNEYPLADLGMTRSDCKRWMAKHGYTIPPRSACVYCPNRCNTEWALMRDLAPDDFAEACRIDDLMRDGLPNLKERAYVHRQLVPLRDADLRSDIDLGQGILPGMGWADCEGMCGV
jgi:hypothetical protein